MISTRDRQVSPPNSTWRSRHLLLLFGVLSTAAACNERDGEPRRRRERPEPRSASAERSTTSGEIALGNLDSQIRGHEKALAARPGDLRSSAAIIDLLATRAEVRGRVEDLERIAAIADDAVAEHSRDGEAHLLAAKAASRFHRFAPAAAALDEAERLGASPRAVATARANLQVATGDLREALPALEAAAKDHPTLPSIGALAAAVADTGDLTRARRLFADALAAYRDVSPFPVAWIEMQEALALERARQGDEAARLYRRVLDRLPGHVPATSHLAALEAREGRRDAAIALLERVVPHTDDPETAGQLSALLRAVGRDAEADRLRTAAASRYAELVARHPEAFADHAARFQLEVMGDAAAALPLAEKNLEVRHTPAAVELALTTAFAAGRTERACTIARGRTVPEELRSRVTAACR